MKEIIKMILNIIIWSTLILIPSYYYPIWSNPRVEVGQVWRDCNWVNHDNPFSGEECEEYKVLKVHGMYILYEYGKNKNINSTELRYFLYGNVELILEVDKNQ